MSVIAGVLGRAGERGQARRKADAKKGICTWRNQPDIQKWMADQKNKAEDAAEAELRARRADSLDGNTGSRSIF